MACSSSPPRSARLCSNDPLKLSIDMRNQVDNVYAGNLASLGSKWPRTVVLQWSNGIARLVACCSSPAKQGAFRTKCSLM